MVAPSGGAKAVQEVSVSTGDNPVEQPPEKQPKAETKENSDGAKKLNYPFTLLEIRENAEISTTSASPTKA